MSTDSGQMRASRNTHLDVIEPMEAYGKILDASSNTITWLIYTIHYCLSKISNQIYASFVIPPQFFINVEIIESHHDYLESI